MTYDLKCQDLADAFLRDTPILHTSENAAQLAQRIQDAIEDWFYEVRGEKP